MARRFLSATDLRAAAEAAQEDPVGDGDVYFLYSCNRIKIGTSLHHQRRIMQGIAPYCPAPLRLLGTVLGGKLLEQRLHRRFEADWIHSEWFALSDALRTFLCEDENRAERLDEAEDDYRIWLEDELNFQKERRR